MEDVAKAESGPSHTDDADAPAGGRSASGSEPQIGDLLIRDFSVSAPGEFIIADALTLRRLQGPFGSIRAAAAAARALRPAGMVWRENVDSRGRALGRPIPLPRPES